MDLLDIQDKFHVLVNQLQKPTDFLHLFGGKKKIPDRTVGLQHIIPTSVISEEGIDELKNCIRKPLDEHANWENNTYPKKYLLTYRYQYDIL